MSRLTYKTAPEVKATSTEYVASSGGRKAIYTGQFVYPRDEWRGAISNIEYSVSGNPVYEIRGLNLLTKFVLDAGRRGRLCARARVR